MVVVAGRPNVGKSSLVNRIVGTPGRGGRGGAGGDPRPQGARRPNGPGVPFSIMDTGGWLAGGDALEAKVSEQAERALAEADVVLMVVDVTTGVTEEDLAAAKVIRRGRPAGAARGEQGRRRQPGGRRLGVRLARPRRPLPGQRAARAGDGRPARRGGGPPAGRRRRRSASTDGTAGRGHADAGRAGEPGTPRVAIIGRPNVGKSTLFNRLLGEERSIVHDMPGTTRDAIDTVVETPDGPVCFIDTAGLRRPSKTDRGTEQHATLRALRALERADVAILVIDATVGASHQDQRLAERIGVSGCPAIVVLNKWDQVAGRRARRRAGRRGGPAGLPGRGAGAQDVRALRQGRAPDPPGAARRRRGVPPAGADRGRSTGPCRSCRARQPAPRAHASATSVQGAIDPPTFTLFANGRLPQTYLRYIERGLREKFDFGATPMKLRVRIGGK